MFDRGSSRSITDARPPWIRRQAPFLALTAVVASLGLFLGLQHHWLRQLEEVSAIAYDASLRNYLESVTGEVTRYYRGVAEQTLYPPTSVFMEQDFEEAVRYFEHGSSEGIRFAFLVDYSEHPYGRYFYYDPEISRMRELLSSDETFAVVIACMPSQMLAIRGGRVESRTVQVDERDPDHRVILRPIADMSTGQMIGTVGFVVDNQYFVETLLPQVAHEVFPGFLERESKEILLEVTREDGDAVFQSWSQREHADHEHAPIGASAFPFVFKDHQVRLARGGPSPDEWARANLRFSLVLSIFIAGVLVWGTVFTWTAARRKMRLSQMKSDFVSNVSHELRTPLASIRMLSELLRGGKIRDENKVREYGTRIESETRRLSLLVDKILDFSRIESGRKVYQFETVDIVQIVRETVESVRRQSAASDFRIDLTVSTNSAGRLSAHADGHALGEAVENLLDNAIKYSRESRRVDVELRREGAEAVIAVRDYGVGIHRSEHAKIFERFHRVGQGLVHDVKGTGLGLSIVEHIVAAHGGEITVESTPGKGSVFSIRLPLLESS